MTRLLKSAIALLALSLCATPATAQNSTDSIAGRWQVQYLDTELGIVSGTAFINRAVTKADVTLVHPETFKEYQFTSSGFAYDGKRRVKFTLKGDWPGKDLSNFPVAAAVEGKEDGRARVTFGLQTKELVSKQNPAADKDAVRIELELKFGHLSGQWHFKANPQNGREQDGNGRLGRIVINDDGSAEQRGEERWSRPNPVVAITVPLDDQMDSSRNEYPSDGDVDFRRLMVFGADLPIREREKIELTAVRDPDIKYLLRLHGNNEIDEAMERLKASMSAGAFASFKRQYDRKALTAMMVEAKVTNKVMPGQSFFEINGTQANWVLKYADFVADLAFVRITATPDDEGWAIPEEKPRPDDVIADLDTGKFVKIENADNGGNKKPSRVAQKTLYENASISYYPEELRLQIKAKRVLPYRAIPIIVSVDGRRTSFDGADTLFAYPDPEDPTRYLSAPIALVGKANPVKATYSEDAIFSSIPVSDKSLITARVDLASVNFPKGVWPFQELTPIAVTRVKDKPDDKSRQGARRSLSWHTALKDAAACYPRVTVTNPTKDSLKVVDSYTRYIVNAWAVENVDLKRKTNILLGDHASMLLLRDTFLDLLENHLDEMRAAAKDNPLGLYKILRPYGYGGAASGQRKAPLLKTKVTGDNGAEFSFYEALGPDRYVTEKFGVKGEKLNAWREEITQAAVSAYLYNIVEAFLNAYAADACDIQELLDITGKGFRGVAAQTFPRLMRKSSITNLWEPDRVARSFVLNLGILADSIELEDELGDKDTQLLIGEVAAVFMLPVAIHGTLALGAYSVGASAPVAFTSTAFMSAAALTVDAVDFGYAVYTAVTKIDKHGVELEFARNSAAIIGYERYDRGVQAEWKIKREAKLDVLLSSLGVVTAADQIYTIKKAVAAGESIFPGRAILKAAYQDPKTFFGNQFKPWPDFSVVKARDAGKLIFQGIYAKSAHLWEKASRLIRGPPKVPAETVSEIVAQTIAELRQQRGLFEDVQANPNHLKELVEKGRITKKQRKNFARRLSQGERLFPDPNAIPAERLQSLAEKVGEDIFQEARKYGLKEEVLISRAVRRMQGALTNDTIYSTAPRLVSGAERAKLSLEELQALRAMYDDVMKLPRAERELLAARLNRASIQATQAGTDILSDEVAAASGLARYITDLANEKPLWAKALSLGEYEKVRGMSLRWDMKALLKDNPAFIKGVINNPVQFDVLRGGAFENVKQLKQAIKRAEKLVKKAMGVFEDAEPALGSPKGFNVTAAYTRDPRNPTLSWVFLKVMRGKKHIGDFSRNLTTLGAAKFNKRVFDNVEGAGWLRKLADDTKVLVFDRSTLKADIGVSSMVKGLKNPMVAGKGTPWSTLMNVRAMRELGVEFGDKSLKVVQVSNIVNKKNMLKVHWLKTMYPTESIHGLLKYTHAYQVAETALQQAGFRIKRAFLTAGTDTVSVSSKAWGGAASFGRGAGKTDELAYMRQYGFTDGSATIEAGHDMYLELVPIAK